MLPPFKNNQSLAADEVIEIYHHAIPNSWKREMKKQGFNPYKSTLVEFIEFCERHEDIEGFTPSEKSSATKKKKNSRNGSKNKDDQKPSGKKYCKVHGYNDTHTTDECKTLENAVGPLYRPVLSLLLRRCCLS